MRIALIGRTEILYKTAKLLIASGHDIALVVTSEEAQEYKVKVEDFQKLAGDLGCPYIKTSKIIEFVEEIKSLELIDIGVSVNYSGVIPRSIIDCFPLGILNAHGGDLPRYRGNACQAWAILNGEEKIGLCIHRMIGGELDSGDIVARDYLPININTKIGEVWNWMEGRAPNLFVEALKKLGNNSTFLIEKQSSAFCDALRCYPRKPEDGRIDWAGNTALKILRLINASSEPYSGAFCIFRDAIMIIWSAELVEDDELYCAIPGQVTKICQNGCVEIATLSGKLRLLDVESDKIRSKPSPSFIRSLRDRLS
jgi:UDP-4-amino-4-deoxy-L-arabinose formyltransferase/UDP-glucuronic acid dehydrogenase (UDP-4-keto-hexauronic acid decarboxylating)